MAENSKIEWCDHTFNPWTGCTKVSAACDHCYAEAWSKRSGHVEWGPHGERRRTKTWGNPVKWNKALEGTGRRERVFCASLSDVFDNHRSIEPEWRRDLFRLIADTPNLDWLLLTKRPQNMPKMLPRGWMEGNIMPNVWLGTTVENQEEADRRIPQLLSIPARVHFLSCEPLLGPVDVETWLHDHGCDYLDDFLGPDELCQCRENRNAGYPTERRVDWIIAGGESGPKARPSHPGWFRSLRDQCADADVPFFFKQWGEWAPTERSTVAGDTTVWPNGLTGRGNANDGGGAGRGMNRVGKKRAGRTLDGVVHDGFPETANA